MVKSSAPLINLGSFIWNRPRSCLDTTMLMTNWTRSSMAGSELVSVGRILSLNFIRPIFRRCSVPRWRRLLLRCWPREGPHKSKRNSSLFIGISKLSRTLLTLNERGLDWNKITTYIGAQMHQQVNSSWKPMSRCFNTSVRSALGWFLC